MKKKKITHFVLAIAVAAVLVTFVLCIVFFVLGSGQKEEFTSPQGTNTIIVKYDFVSRPTIYKKGKPWDKKVWEYSGSGFNETVYFNVEWLSESKIRFTYDDANDKYDEEYIIEIP